MTQRLLFVLAGAAFSWMPAALNAQALVLRPDGVFDGTTPTVHRGWVVVVEGDRIAAAGPER